MAIPTLLFILLIGAAALKTLGLVEFNAAKRRDLFFGSGQEGSYGMPVESAASAEVDYDVPTFMRRGVPLPDLEPVLPKQKKKRTRKSAAPKADVVTAAAAAPVAAGFGGFEVVA
jgi:hypothetical protein